MCQWKRHSKPIDIHLQCKCILSAVQRPKDCCRFCVGLPKCDVTCTVKCGGQSEIAGSHARRTRTTSKAGTVRRFGKKSSVDSENSQMEDENDQAENKWLDTLGLKLNSIKLVRIEKPHKQVYIHITWKWFYTNTPNRLCRA